jgi:membrane associated rhomboid family serine protease
MANLSLYLLAIMGILFFLQLFTGIDNGIITSLFIFAPSVALTEPWRFVTSIFLHGSIMHLFFNAYALFLFGTILERQVSKGDYLLIFFGAGFAGSLLYYMTYVLGIIPPIPALGASGAIYGILGAVAVLLPDMRIYMWFFPMRMREAAMFWVVLELIGAFNISSGIASAAHLGGLVFGLLYAWHLKRKVQEPQTVSVGGWTE